MKGEINAVRVNIRRKMYLVPFTTSIAVFEKKCLNFVKKNNLIFYTQCTFILNILIKLMLILKVSKSLKSEFINL